MQMLSKVDIEITVWITKQNCQNTSSENLNDKMALRLQRNYALDNETLLSLGQRSDLSETPAYSPNGNTVELRP